MRNLVLKFAWDTCGLSFHGHCVLQPVHVLTIFFQTPKLYCGGDIGDLTEILQHIRTNIGEAPLVTVAMSMGRSGRDMILYILLHCLFCLSRRDHFSSKNLAPLIIQHPLLK